MKAVAPRSVPGLAPAAAIADRDGLTHWTTEGAYGS
jgi:hypothetical protein